MGGWMARWLVDGVAWWLGGGLGWCGEVWGEVVGWVGGGVGGWGGRSVGWVLGLGWKQRGENYGDDAEIKYIILVQARPLETRFIEVWIKFKLVFSPDLSQAATPEAGDLSPFTEDTWRAGRTLSGKTLSGRTLSERTLSERTLSGRTLSGRTLSGRTL